LFVIYPAFIFGNPEGLFKLGVTQLNPAFFNRKDRKVNRKVTQRYILKLCVTLRSARRADKAQRVRQVKCKTGFKPVLQSAVS